MTGWIKLHRQFRDSPYYKIGAAVQTWLECLLRASHEPREIFLKRRRVTLQPGQFVMGRAEFGASIGLSGSTAWYWLQQFKADNMIDIGVTSKGSVVTLKNWSEYQTIDSTPDNRKTTNEQDFNSNKKDKKVKNEKTYVLRPETESLYEWIQQRCVDAGIENQVDKRSLDLIVERYVGQIHMKVELDHYIAWMVENDKRMLNASRVGNCFKRQKEYQKKQQRKLLEKSKVEKIGQVPLSSVDHFTSSPFAK